MRNSSRKGCAGRDGRNRIECSELEKEKTDLQGFDAVLLGAATYHGEMMQPMKTLLFALEKANLEGKVGGSFGAYGWSGEAPGRIYQTMQNVLKMRMVTGPLMLKSASVLGGLKMAQEYGRTLREVSNMHEETRDMRDGRSLTRIPSDPCERSLCGFSAFMTP